MKKKSLFYIYVWEKYSMLDHSIPLFMLSALTVYIIEKDYYPLQCQISKEKYGKWYLEAHYSTRILK